MGYPFLRTSWMHYCLQYEQAAERVGGAEVVAALQRIGFRIRRQHGSHMIMRRDEPFAQTVVPAHREIDRGTLRAILRQIDLSVEDFIRLL